LIYFFILILIKILNVLLFVEYDSDNDPLKLVYTSPSFMNEKDGPMQVVLVYEVNKNYILIKPHS
jgi:hypothetical protein